MEYRVTFYSPVREPKPLARWLRDLRVTRPVLGDLVVSGLEKLRNGDHHRKPLVEMVDPANRIYEMRVGRANIARVFFFYDGDEIICTNGYVKQRNRLDQGELDRARRYQHDWMGRKP